MTGGLTMTYATTTNKLVLGSTNPTTDDILFVTGNSYFDGNATTTGWFYIGQDLTVNGSLNANIIQATSTLDSWFRGTAGIDTDDLTQGSSNLYQDSELTNWIDNVTLGTNGDLETEGYASSTTGLFTQGNIHAGGNLTVDGSYNLTTSDIQA